MRGCDSDHRWSKMVVSYIRSVIGHADFLREMPECDLAALAGAATLQRYRGGDYLWRVGDSRDFLEVVAEGLVQIGVMAPDAREVLLQVVASGECMGEADVYVQDYTRRSDGRAVTRTVVVRVPGDTVRAVLEASPAAMPVFVRRVSEIARGHARRVVLTGLRDGRGRLTQLLLDLVDSHGVKTERGHRIELFISQRTLGGLAGLSRESVNRIVSELVLDGTLVFEGGRVTILKESVLRSAVGSAILPTGHGSGSSSGATH